MLCSDVVMLCCVVMLTDRQTDRWTDERTDIGGCRVAFATENANHCLDLHVACGNFVTFHRSKAILE